MRRTSYPQVEARAGDLATPAVAEVTPGLAIAEAARVARRRAARLLLARVGAGWGGVTPDTLERALALGLEAAPLAVALWGAPGVGRAVPEVTVRRALGPATPFVVVAEADRPVGAVFRESDAGRPLPRSAASALARLPARTQRLLREAGALAEASGAPVAAVGGFARDLLLDRPGVGQRDLDLAVEADGRLFARRLAALWGGTVREHATFLTATVLLADGGTPTRIDVATTRRERYRRPGALPVVEPAGFDEDLGRRDFAVNALAIRLDGAAWGAVLDPMGGLDDLARGRVRVLHPLAFVEDPTRIFRAARFATRLGFALDPTTRRLLAAAARLGVYDALSGDRLLAELDAIAAEPAPADVLIRLGRLGAFRLGLAGYRFSPGAAARVARAAAAGRGLGLGHDAVRGLYLLALSHALAPEAALAWLDRWSPPAPQRAMLQRARRDVPGLAAALETARGPAAAFARLRGVPELVAAWASVLARRAPVRRHVAAYLQDWRHLRPLLGGDDLTAMGIRPGPRLGRLLEGLCRAQASGRLRTRAQAAAWVRRAAARGLQGDNGRDPEKGA